jgi:arginase
MRIALIEATWPVKPFGATWYELPDAMSAAGLRQALIDDGHHVDEYELDATGPAATELRGAFALGAAIAERCRAAIESGAFPVIVCGSCGVAAIGAMAGLAGERTGVVWMDAHPDLNTPETSGSGMFDGMALSAALGLCWSHMGREITGLTLSGARDVCLIGSRDIDPGEAVFIAEHAIPMTDRAPPAVSYLANCARVYVHLDMDVHDALQVRANRFAVPGGLNIDQVRETLVGLTRGLPVAALSVTGLDPAAPDSALAIRAAIDHIRAVCETRSAL